MKDVKVNQMIGRKGPVKNQFVIVTGDAEYFQSYKSIIVKRPVVGKIQLDLETWDYSATTGKYRNLFLSESKKETEAKIKSGEYELVNLN